MDDGVGDELIEGRVVGALPAFDGGFGDGVGGGGVGDWVIWEGDAVELEGFAVGEGDKGGKGGGVGLVVPGVEGLASGSGDFAEDGVGHASGFGADVVLGPFDGFIDDGVGRKAVQQQKLGRGTDEDGLHTGFDGFKASACELGDDVAKGDPAGNGLSNDRMAQSAVPGIKLFDFWIDWMEVWEVVGVPAQDAIGRITGVCGGRISG